MTPTQHAQLAAMLRERTGQPWRDTNEALDPALGVTRGGEPLQRVTLLRSGFYGNIPPWTPWAPVIAAIIGPGGRWTMEWVSFGQTFSGRGWIPRLVDHAIPAIAAWEARHRPAAADPREARRREHYRRLLDPKNNAEPGEVAEARRRLGLETR